MLTSRNLFSLALAVAGMALIAGDAVPAMAQSGGGSRLRISASMSAGRTRAVAKYEQRSNRRKFTFELEKGAPGTVITVRHNGAILARRTIDSLGNAKVDFDTTNGNSVAVMSSGQEVSVWVGSGKVMSGVLR